MILNGDFYKIAESNIEAEKIQATLLLNLTHVIFGGHFPGQPVVPGVCMLQMIKELIEMATKQSLQLTKGSELKFLALIDPRENKLINVELGYTQNDKREISVLGRFFYNEITFFKFKGIFVSRGNN